MLPQREAQCEAAARQQCQRRDARADQRIEPGVGVRLRKGDEEAAEGETGAERFGNSGRKAARLGRARQRRIDAVGRFGSDCRDQHDGNQRERDAGQRERRRTVAVKECERHRNRGCEHSRDRRNDAHRADRQRAVQQPDRCGTGDAAGRAPPEIGEVQHAGDERQHRQQQDESDRLRPHQHGHRGHPPRGQAAAKVGRAVEDGARDRERDDHVSASWGRARRAGRRRGG